MPVVGVAEANGSQAFAGELRQRLVDWPSERLIRSHWWSIVTVVSEDNTGVVSTSGHQPVVVIVRVKWLSLAR